MVLSVWGLRVAHRCDTKGIIKSLLALVIRSYLKPTPLRRDIPGSPAPLCRESPCNGRCCFCVLAYNIRAPELRELEWIRYIQTGLSLLIHGHCLAIL